MTKLFLILILLNLGISCGDGFDKKKKPKTGRFQDEQQADTFSINQEYLQLVNDHRIAMKLRPLTYHHIVEEISLSHAKAMASHARPFGHVGFSVRCRRLKNRLGRINLCGEIVAMGQKSIQDVFAAWLNSPKHREAIEQQSFTHTALGIYKDRRGVRYWAQMFVEI